MHTLSAVLPVNFKVQTNSPMVAAIHQPNYVPWPGYFYKIRCCDIFVFLDDVQYSGRGVNAVINRNKIKCSTGYVRLTVPVIKSSLDTLICNVAIDYSQTWAEKHLKTLRYNYGRTKYFQEVFSIMEKNLMVNCDSLAELNISIIRDLSAYLGLNTNFIRSSEIPKNEAAKDELLISILDSIGASTYLSGKGGLKYMNLDLYRDRGIQVQVSQYMQMPYPQMFGEYVEGLSILDLLFNCGKNSSEYL